MNTSRLDRIGRLALLAAAALVPLLVARGSHDDKLISSQVLVLLAAGLCLPRLLAGAGAATIPAFAWAAVPVLAFAAAAARHAAAPTAGPDLARHLLFLLAFFAGAAILARPDLRRLAALWTVTLVPVLAYAAVQKAGWDPVEEFRKFHSQSRPFATFGNPDFLGVHLAFLAPLVLAFAASARNAAARNAGWAVAGVSLVALFWTGSRGAWLGAAAGIVATGALARSGGAGLSGGIPAKARLPAAAAAALALILLAPGIMSAVQRRTDRIPLWQGTMTMIRAKPLAGWGLASFASEFPPFAPAEFAARMKADNTFAEHPHSEYLHVAAETGLPALGIFIWLLAAAVHRALRAARAGSTLAAGALGGLAAVLVHILVDRNFRLASTAVPFWILAGVLFAPRKPSAPAAMGGSFSLPPAAYAAGVAVAVALAAVSLRPLTAALRVEAEADFLAEASDVPAAELERQAAAHAGDTRFLIALGNAWAKEKNFPRAVGSFQEALRLDPANAGAALNLGNCHFMMSDFGTAAEVYRGMLARDPGHRDARFNLAMSYYYQRRVKEALAEVETLLRREPANAKALQLKRQLSP